MKKELRVFGESEFKWQEHVVNVEQCYKLTNDIPWQSALCLDPAIFALGGVRYGQVRVGDRVVVFGLGAIGLMTVQLARCAGAATIVAVDPTNCDSGMESKIAFDNKGADVAIDFSGNVHALQSAIRSVAFGATVVCGAFPPPYPAGLDFGAEAHMNIPNIVFSRACSEPNREHPRWNIDRIKETCLQMLLDGMISGEAIIDPVVDFEELPIAYPKVVPNPEAGIKLGVRH